MEVRTLMRRFPSGVAVVTFDAGGRPSGVTVGSLVSLSLEPPLVGFALSRQTQPHELVREAGSFAVSLLGAGQEAIAQHFARSVPPIALWEDIPLRPGTGAPLIEGALGWLECELRSEHDAGDHTWFVGEVTSVEAGAPASPLVFVDGAYRSL